MTLVVLISIMWIVALTWCASDGRSPFRTTVYCPPLEFGGSLDKGFCGLLGFPRWIFVNAGKMLLVYLWAVNAVTNCVYSVLFRFCRYFLSCTVDRLSQIAFLLLVSLFWFFLCVIRFRAVPIFIGHFCFFFWRCLLVFVTLWLWHLTPFTVEKADGVIRRSGCSLGEFFSLRWYDLSCCVLFLYTSASRKGIWCLTWITFAKMIFKYLEHDFELLKITHHNFFVIFCIKWTKDYWWESLKFSLSPIIFLIIICYIFLKVYYQSSFTNPPMYW